jgi:hypothetical protein
VTVTPLRPDAAVDADLFRALLRRHAAAVVVVTAPGEPAGRDGDAAGVSRGRVRLPRIGGLTAGTVVVSGPLPTLERPR